MVREEVPVPRRPVALVAVGRRRLRRVVDVVPVAQLQVRVRPAGVLEALDDGDGAAEDGLVEAPRPRVVARRRERRARGAERGHVARVHAHELVRRDVAERVRRRRPAAAQEHEVRDPLVAGRRRHGVADEADVVRELRVPLGLGGVERAVEGPQRRVRLPRVREHQHVVRPEVRQREALDPAAREPRRRVRAAAAEEVEAHVPGHGLERPPGLRHAALREEREPVRARHAVPAHGAQVVEPGGRRPDARLGVRELVEHDLPQVGVLRVEAVLLLEQLREGLRGAARARVAVRPQERPGHGLEALALERRHGAARRPAPQGAGLDRARPLELRVAHGGLAVGRAAREQLRERDEGRAGPVGAALAEHPLGHHALQVAALLVARRVDADGDAVHVRAEPNVQIDELLPPGDGRLQEGVRDGAGRRHHEEKEAPRLLHWRRSRAL